MLSFVVNPAARTREKTAAAYDAMGETFDEGLASELAAVLRDNGTWQCPTLIRLHTQQFPLRHAGDPRARFMHSRELAAWRAADERFAKLPEATREALEVHRATELAVTRVLHEEGVPMLTGTDASGAGWVVPGFSLQDEFALLAEAGIAAPALLRMATLDAARFLGRDDVAGRVAPGLQADLVVLDADPTLDHEALSAIGGVVRAGGWFGREALDEMLRRAEARPRAR
ncbi:hypothetical protein GCM10027268_02790 [Brachybacterium huguangmaarense]